MVRIGFIESPAKVRKNLNPIGNTIKYPKSAPQIKNSEEKTTVLGNISGPFTDLSVQMTLLLLAITLAFGFIVIRRKERITKRGKKRDSYRKK